MTPKIFVILFIMCIVAVIVLMIWGRQEKRSRKQNELETELTQERPYRSTGCCGMLLLALLAVVFFTIAGIAHLIRLM